MYQKERLDKILEVVSEYGYVTVKYLVGRLHYSNATVNRDLNILEGQGLVKRTYGGVEVAKTEEVPLPFRYHKMHVEKLKISEAAAELIEDGDTVFIDASTTTEYMADFLREKKDITVITNNLAIVMRLAEFKINVICLGGKISEPPCMLDGIETVEAAARYHADKMFFATGYVSEKGWIGAGDMYYLLQSTMAKNSDKIYYLADHEKLTRNQHSRRKLMEFDTLTGIISDYDFCEETKRKYPNVKFIRV